MTNPRLFSKWLILFVIIITTVSCSGPSQYEISQKSKDQREIGEAYMRQGNYTAGLAELLKAEKLTPDDHILQNDLGLCYLGKNSLDMAVRHLQKAVKLKPDYAPAQNNLGVVYLKQKNWNAAIDTFKKITGNLLYASPHYPLSNLGEAYYNLGNLPKAEYYYLKALKEKPNFPIALRGLGQIYIKMNRPQDAIVSLEKAAENAPQSAAVYFDLASAYQLKSDQKRSIYAYEKVLELAPDSQLAKKAELQIYRMTGKR